MLKYSWSVPTELLGLVRSRLEIPHHRRSKEKERQLYVARIKMLQPEYVKPEREFELACNENTATLHPGTLRLRPVGLIDIHQTPDFKTRHSSIFCHQPALRHSGKKHTAPQSRICSTAPLRAARRAQHIQGRMTVTRDIMKSAQTATWKKNEERISPEPKWRPYAKHSMATAMKAMNSCKAEAAKMPKAVFDNIQ